MNYLCEVASTRPLAIHFSLSNPANSGGPLFVPRVLGPLGLFVRVTVKDERGRVLVEPPAIRGTWKLDPADQRSYLALEPGYTFGALFLIDDAPTGPGTFRLLVEYSNAPYTGTPGTPVGKLSFKRELEVLLPSP